MKIFAKNNLKYDYNIKCDKDIKFPGGEIKMKIQIEEEVVGKTIYFLDNTDYIEFSHAEDGSLYITLKHIGSIVNKR